MYSQTLRLRFAALLLVSLFMVTVYAGAQTQPLPGWTAQAVPGGVMLTSPVNWKSPSLILGLVTPSFIAEPTESWFTSQTIARSQAAGVPLAATGILHNGQLLIRVVKIQTPEQTLRAVFYTYPAAGQQQMAILFVPEKVGDNDSRLQAAYSYVGTLAARQVDLGPMLASASGPQPVSPGIATASPSPVDELQRLNNQRRQVGIGMSNSATSTIMQMQAMSH